MNEILVTGATGTLGRPLVQLLAGHGAGVRVLSRRPRPTPAPPHQWCTGDLRSGQGIEAAAAGTGTIIHCATGRGDVAAARVLLAAAQRAGRPHLVYISIVGIDQIPVGSYRSKLETERLIADSGLPWTILRATQFHQLLARGCAALARLPVLPVPAATSFQPIDAGEVAARLAELATGAPAGRVPDLAGPQVRTAADLARSYLQAAGRHRRVQPVWLPGRVAAALRQGALLAPGHAGGRVTFEEFLASRPGARTAAAAGPHLDGETRPGAGGAAVTRPGRAWLRAALVLLAVIQAVTGAWQYFAPRSFFNFPTVAAGAPFNEHLMTDVGGLGMALAVVLGAAALRMERGLVQAALAGYLVYSVSHLAFHASHLMGLPAPGAALLLTGLVLLPAFALALLLVAARVTAPDGRRGEVKPARLEPRSPGRG